MGLTSRDSDLVVKTKPSDVPTRDKDKTPWSNSIIRDNVSFGPQRGKASEGMGGCVSRVSDRMLAQVYVRGLPPPSESKPRKGHRGYVVFGTRMNYPGVEVVPVIVARRQRLKAHGRGASAKPAVVRIYLEKMPEPWPPSAPRVFDWWANDIYFTEPKLLSNFEVNARYPTKEQRDEALFGAQHTLNHCGCRSDGGDGLHLYVDDAHEILLFDALVAPAPSGLWWASSSEALERPATMYEARFPSPPPSEGWRLVDGAAHSAMLKRLPARTSELDQKERGAKVLKIEKELRRACAVLACYRCRHAPQSTVVKKWEKKIAAIKRKLQRT